MKFFKKKEEVKEVEMEVEYLEYPIRIYVLEVTLHDSTKFFIKVRRLPIPYVDGNGIVKEDMEEVADFAEFVFYNTLVDADGVLHNIHQGEGLSRVSTLKIAQVEEERAVRFKKVGKKITQIS